MKVLSTARERVEDMLRVNNQQTRYYDAIAEAELRGCHGYSATKEAGMLTRMWATARHKQAQAVKQAGIRDRVQALHARHIDAKEGGHFLEIGCFTGSEMSFYLAEKASSFVGIELSPKAVEKFNEQLAARGLAKQARGHAADFLSFESPHQFDIIYAHGVLHHFQFCEVAFDRVRDLLKDDGVLIFQEPSEVNGLYALIRRLYRPFQSDSDWEWPFTARTVGALNERFTTVEAFGWGRRSLPFSVLSALPLVGSIFRKVYRHLIARELSDTNPRWLWHNSVVAAVMRKRVPTGKAAADLVPQVKAGATEAHLAEAN